MRMIDVSQPALTSSELALAEAGDAYGSFGFRGLLRRTAWLRLGSRELTFRTVGLLGRAIRVTDDGEEIGTFRRKGLKMGGEAVVGGRTYLLRSSGVLTYHFDWRVADEADAPAVVALEVKGMLRISGTIEVADGVDPTDAAVLIGLGLTVARQVADGDSSAGAAGAG